MTSVSASETPIDIFPLSANRLDDFLKFFDQDAFRNHPEWSSCYCQCYYEDHHVIRWSDRTATQNRTLACSRTRDGLMQGHLAYMGEQVVGWCNAASRPLLHSLDGDRPVDQSVGVILCFVIAPQWRRTGIARRLLRAACEHFQTTGHTQVEANPRSEAVSDADNHYGPLRMYLSEGFAPFQTDAEGSIWVRKLL